jgi:hypothetical protein
LGRLWGWGGVFVPPPPSYNLVLIAVCVMWPRYATASARSDGLLLLCGGRDANSVVRFILSAGVISTVVYHKICEPFKHIWLFDHFMILLYPVYMLYLVI